MPDQPLFPAMQTSTADIAADAHGKGQEDAIATIARWLDLRAGLRVGAGRAENLAIADLLRTGDWLEELEEISQCKL